MEGEQRHQTLEEGSHHGEKTGIYDAKEWFECAKDSELEKEYVEEPFMRVADVAGLNTKLNRDAAEQRAYKAADNGRPMSSMPNAPKKQKPKQPEKPGFFAKIFSWFSGKKS